MLGEDGFFHVFSMCFLQVLMVFLGSSNVFVCVC